MTPVEGVARLFGSSVRGGVEVPGNSVTVILTPEALERAIPAGWATWHSRTFNSHLSGALIYWPWKDMAAPVLDEQMVARITELHTLHQSGKTIEVACYGGHGRTGTLLAILAALDQGWSAAAAVGFLRENYCEKAVETESQERFVEEAILAVRSEFARRAAE